MGAILPKPGEEYSFSAHELQEYVKCAQDPVYFIRTYMKITHPDRGLIPFEMYDYQEEMVRSYHANRFNITMCSRQVGKSTVVIGFFLWYILFNVNVATCISANKQKTAADLLGRLKLGYENLPRFLQQNVVRWARLEIELENGSKCFAAATSSSAVRGGSYSMLLLDEYAFVPPNVADEFYASTFPTISAGKTTKLIMVSTPNGMNHFHQFWTDAKHKRNDFVPIEVDWTRVPGRDEQWKQTTIRNIGGIEKFAQEYENSFLSSSYTLIRPATLKALTYEPPIAETPEGYREYHAPVKGHQYVLTVDTANGQGLDYSAFTITDVTSMPYRVAATYANNRINTMEYPAIIMRYAERYFLPWILCEVNDIGRDVAYILFRDYEYDKLLTTISEPRLGQKMTFGTGRDRHPGLRMTPGSKRSGCATVKALIEHQQLIINDHRILNQLATFVQKGNSYEAEEGHNDDLVMSLVILAWATLQPNFAEVSEARALDAYLKVISEPVEGETIAPVIEEHIDAGGDEPMPVGIMNGVGYVGDDDSNWLR